MNLIRRIRPEKTGVRAPLGDLELAVMRHIWSCREAGCLGVEVQKAVEADRPLALTTILTTLDRLHDKNILVREREGKAYRYRAALSETELQERIVSGVLGDLFAQFPQAVATYFAQQMSEAAGASDNQPDLGALAQRLAEMHTALPTARDDEAHEDGKGA